MKDVFLFFLQSHDKKQIHRDEKKTKKKKKKPKEQKARETRYQMLYLVQHLANPYFFITSYKPVAVGIQTSRKHV